MEKTTLQQKLEMAMFDFPVETKVCNYKIGTVGVVCGEPFVDLTSRKIFVPVSYNNQEFHEDAEMILKIRTVKKGLKRHS